MLLLALAGLTEQRIDDTEFKETAKVRSQDFTQSRVLILISRQIILNMLYPEF